MLNIGVETPGRIVPGEKENIGSGEKENIVPNAHKPKQEPPDPSSTAAVRA